MVKTSKHTNTGQYWEYPFSPGGKQTCISLCRWRGHVYCGVRGMMVLVAGYWVFRMMVDGWQAIKDLFVACIFITLIGCLLYICFVFIIYCILNMTDYLQDEIALLGALLLRIMEKKGTPNQWDSYIPWYRNSSISPNHLIIRTPIIICDNNFRIKSNKSNIIVFATFFL